MGVGINSSFVLKVLDVHGDHRRLFFLDIKVLDQALSQSLVEVHLVVPLALQFLDVPLLQEDLAIFDNEERSHHPATISEEPDFLVKDVTDN